MSGCIKHSSVNKVPLPLLSIVASTFAFVHHLSKWNIKKICHCRRNMFVQLEVLYFAQPLKLKFKASLALRFDYYGTRVHPASICFLDYKEILSKFTFAICSIRNFFFSLSSKLLKHRFISSFFDE
jgi:hypothetical protein